MKLIEGVENNIIDTVIVKDIIQNFEEDSIRAPNLTATI